MAPKDNGSTPRFVWEDPLLLSEQLSEEERMVRDAAADFAQQELMPRVHEAFRHETVDADIIPLMGKVGLLGPTVPAEYGGAGLNYVCYGLIAREIERVDSGYRSMMSVQSSLVMFPIFTYGTEAQRRKYLPRLASGEWIGCFGLDGTESRVRSREHGIACARRARGVPHDGQQDVDLELADRGRVRGLGQDR